MKNEKWVMFTSEDDSSSTWGGWNMGYWEISAVALMGLIWVWVSARKEQLGCGGD